MKRASAALGLLVGCVVASACSAPDRVTSPPPFPTLDLVGVLDRQEIYADHRVFVLANGRVWDQPNDSFRMAYERPAGSTLFVQGSDAQGVFVLLVGGQDGLPPDCRHAIGNGGVDWGNAVEAAGFLWRKAPDYAGPVVPVGTEIGTSSRFCLDDLGRVSSLAALDTGGSTPPSQTTNGAQPSQ